MLTLQRTGAVLAGAAAVFAASPAFAVESAAPQTAASQPAAEAVALATDGVAAKAGASCPKTIVAPDGATFPKADDAYKATVESVAGDCADLGAETILKVAVVGEGARDSKSGPSWFNAPLRVSVRDAEGKPVETRKVKVRVQLPTGAQTVAFNHLEDDVSLPPAPGGGYAGWTVVVGFDPAGQPAAAKPKAAKAMRAAAVRRAEHVAQAAPRPAPLPPAAPAPASSLSQFQKLAQANAERQQQAAQAKADAERSRAIAAQRQARLVTPAPKTQAD